VHAHETSVRNAFARSEVLMKTHSARSVPVIGIVCCIGLGAAFALAQELPVVKGKKIVASVNGDPITLDELTREIAGVKKARTPAATVDRQAELGVLQRVINTRLIVQEARNIGLDKLTENKMMVDAFAREALREELAEKVMAGAKVDEKEVDKIYKDAVREWKVNAVLCDKEDDANRFEAELRTGKSFAELAKAFKADGRAKQIEEGVYLKPTDMDRQFARTVSGLTVGSTSSVVRTTSGFAVLRLEDVRYGENPEEKEKAREAVLELSRREKLKAYNESLKKKFVTVKQVVLDGVDYEAPSPGFDALLKDSRVVAEIKGDKAVTVGELTEQLRYQFFHGLDRAVERKRLNARKGVTLEGIIHRRLFRREALRQGLDKTESYRGTLRDYEAGLLFEAFIRKVIQPDIKLTETEVKAYYDAHAKEYSAPEMMRIRSLAFRSRGDAESVIEKLKEGAEFQWLAAHAEGQVEGNAKGVWSFDGKPVMTQDLPDGMQKALAGARVGDVRLYSSRDGYFYALAIQDVIPSKPQPYQDARQTLAQRVMNDKVTKAVEEYAGKLRSASDVKVYLKS
jgi:parvulin-like peptidyl-prolyl isomerase